jgi:hypothetical protein
MDTSDIKDVPPGKMKHVEVEENEILLAKCMHFAIDAVT